MLDLAAAGQERHERFVRQVVETREVWGLQSNEGWCVSQSTGENYQDCPAQPFWSNSAHAAVCANADWAEYEPAAIPLFKFIIAWLTGLAEDGVLVGTNWNKNLVGHEIEPAALQRELIGSMPSDTRADYEDALAHVRKKFDNPSYQVLPTDRAHYRFPVRADPSPPPPRRKRRDKRPALPTEFKDNLLLWEMPKKPWRIISPPHEGTIVGMKFGKNWTGISFHLIASESIDDASAWVADRFVKLFAEKNAALDSPAELEYEAKELWRRYELIGPTDVDVGALAARSYYARAQDITIRCEWLIIDISGAQRVVELYTEESRRWPNDRKEALKALASLRPK
jgi:hypothetical protein